MANSYRDLKVWQRSIQLSLAVYRLSAGFPKDELYGLTSQLRRAGISVASNIAEGYGRNTRGDYKQFLSMARGSVFEVQTQVFIAGELGYRSPADRSEVDRLSDEVSKMLYALIDKL